MHIAVIRVNVDKVGLGISVVLNYYFRGEVEGLNQLYWLNICVPDQFWSRVKSENTDQHMEWKSFMM